MGENGWSDCVTLIPIPFRWTRKNMDPTLQSTFLTFSRTNVYTRIKEPLHLTFLKERRTHLFTTAFCFSLLPVSICFFMLLHIYTFHGLCLVITNLNVVIWTLLPLYYHMRISYGAFFDPMKIYQYVFTVVYNQVDDEKKTYRAVAVCVGIQVRNADNTADITCTMHMD